jgi:hypothetical protein
MPLGKNAGVIEDCYMQSKFKLWFGALLCLSIFLRVIFYYGLKIKMGLGFERVDLIGLLIGVFSAYLSYMYFKKIFFSKKQI